MANEFVLGLDDPALTSVGNRFGVKAATLARLRQAGFSVPPGFVLDASFHELMRATKYHPRTLPDLSDEFRMLMEQSETGRLIVRSSGLVEDHPEHLFPGIFESISEIQTLTELYDAITRCMQSAETERVANYCKLVGIPTDRLLLAVIVQVQVAPIFAGVAFTQSPLSQHAGQTGILVEFIPGHSRPLLRGSQGGNAVFLRHNPGELAVDQVHSRSSKPIDVPRAFWNEFYGVANRLVGILESPQDIEWAYTVNGLVILQSRSIVNSGFPSFAAKRVSHNMEVAPIFAEEPEIGLKGAAMRFFMQNHLFNKPFALLMPSGSFHEFEGKVRATNFGTGSITVRFSHGQDLGLPRYFARSKEEALRFVKEKWNSSWLGIVHSFLDVGASFELYVDKRRSLLESVPGIWESENVLPPDVVELTSQQTTLLRVVSPRLAKFVFPTGARKMDVPPRSFEEMADWGTRIQPVIDLVKQQLGEHLPLNIHFVQGEGPEWHFLNMRRSERLPTIPPSQTDLHIIEHLRDMEHWDGKRALLLRVNIERGQEDLVVSLVPRLKEAACPIYIESGLLSHPAIVLREFGIQPLPLYSTHEKRILEIKGSDTV
jgi:hypothetical protein